VGRDGTAVSPSFRVWLGRAVGICCGVPPVAVIVILYVLAALLRIRNEAVGLRGRPVRDSRLRPVVRPVFVAAAVASIAALALNGRVSDRASDRVMLIALGLVVLSCLLDALIVIARRSARGGNGVGERPAIDRVD
jgi:hypothetical protein